MDLLKEIATKQIVVEVSGNIVHIGLLVTIGVDVIVLYNGKDFLYIPCNHIQKIYLKDDDTTDISPFEGKLDESLNENISFRKMLNNARGIFSEIHIANNRTIHGYIVSVMTNYVVFYSPVFKTVYVSLQHIKWFIPYHNQEAPYALSKEHFPIQPTKLTLARTFEEQLKKLKNQIVILDLGQDDNKIGQLKVIENNIVKLITARQTPSFVNLRHIKTIHLP